MTDPNEIGALQSSFRGALSTAAALQALESKVQNFNATADVTAEDLDELARVTAAHAIASAALRGLVLTMLNRREPRVQ